MPRARTLGVWKSVGGSSCVTGEGADDGKEEGEGERESEGGDEGGGEGEGEGDSEGEGKEGGKISMLRNQAWYCLFYEFT